MFAAGACVPRSLAAVPFLDALQRERERFRGSETTALSPLLGDQTTTSVTYMERKGHGKY